MIRITSPRTTGLFFGFCTLIFLFGCLGGGGGGGKSAFGPGVAPDASAITQTVTTFMQAMVRGQAAEASRLLSPRLQTATTSGNVIASITLFDFGLDIYNAADDASWTFLIREGGINQTSESFASVIADGITPDGKLLQVAFDLVKIENSWYIDDIRLIDADGNSYDMPSMFPMNPGDEWVYTLTPTNSSSGSKKVRRVVGPQVEILDGKKVGEIYEYSETISSLSPQILPQASTGIRTLFYPNRTKERFANEGGVNYYGSDLSFNNNVPLKIVGSKARPGDVSTQTITLTVDGKTSAADVQIRILPEETLVTPLKSLLVLPIELYVTYREPFLFSYSKEREIWYLSAHLGLVGFQVFDPNDPTKPLYQSGILEASVGGVTFLSTTEMATPTWLAVFPASSTTDVSPQTVVYADCSKALAPLATTATQSISVTASGQAVIGTPSVTGNRLAFQPATNLPEGSEITVTIASTVRDIRGIALGRPYIWKFTTGRVGGNRAPTFVKGSDITVGEDSGPFTHTAWATSISPGADSETAQNLTFQVRTEQSALFAANAAPMISSAGTLLFTPAPDAFGSATIEVSLKDDGGTTGLGADTSATQTFTITITPVNDSPIFTKGANVSANLASGAQALANWAGGIVPGPANEAEQALQFIVTPSLSTLFQVPPTISADGTLSFTPAKTGTTLVSVQLTDTGGTADGGVSVSAVQTFEISIFLPNQPPSFTKGADIAMTPNEGEKIVAAWATAISPGHAEESAQVLEFHLTNTRPDLFSVQPAIPANGTLSFTPYGIGTAEIGVSLKDNGGTLNGGQDVSATQTFTITLSSAPNRSVTWKRCSPQHRIFNGGCAVINNRIFVFGGEDSDGDLFNRMEEYLPATNEWVSLTGDHDLPYPRSGFGYTVHNNTIYIAGGYKNSLPTFDDSAMKYDTTNGWQTMTGATLSSNREGSAVVVYNDFLHVIGGSNGGTVLDSVEILDLSNIPNGFSPDAYFLNTERCGHSATVFDGQIIVVGGYDDLGDQQVTVERSTGSGWTTNPNTLNTERSGFALLNTGSALWAISGRTSGTNAQTMEELTSVAGTWSIHSSGLRGMEGHVGAIVDGRPMIFGGMDDSMESTPHVQECRNGQWVFKTLPKQLSYPGVAALNGKLTVFGGCEPGYVPSNNAWEYDLQTHTWRALTAMNTSGGSQGGAGVINNLVYSVSDDGSTPIPFVCYNPSTNAWESRTGLPGASRSYLAGATMLGNLHILGGYDGNPVADHYAFNPATNAWTTLSSLPIADLEHSAAAMNNRFCVFGGSQNLQGVNEFNPLTNSWTSKASIPDPIIDAIAVACAGKLFLLGGSNNSLGTAVNSALEFDPFTNSWNASPSHFSFSRSDLGAAVIENQIFIVGGENDDGDDLGHLEIGTVQ
jgi:N-acetylneuraminic acid mutarotase